MVTLEQSEPPGHGHYPFLPCSLGYNFLKQRTFSEVGATKHGKNGKLGHCRVPMVFIGYQDDHSSEC